MARRPKVYRRIKPPAGNSAVAGRVCYRCGRPKGCIPFRAPWSGVSGYWHLRCFDLDRKEHEER